MAGVERIYILRNLLAVTVIYVAVYFSDIFTPKFLAIQLFLAWKFFTLRHAPYTVTDINATGE